jgi:hypothetical protein
MALGGARAEEGTIIRGPEGRKRVAPGVSPGKGREKLGVPFKGRHKNPLCLLRGLTRLDHELRHRWFLPARQPGGRGCTLFL